MKFILSILLVALCRTTLFAQTEQFKEKEVYRGKDVVFRQIDAHTWVGTGKMMSNESLYLIEGNDRAILLDAGTEIADLDQIVASITKKPVTLIATHVHPDHTGSAIRYFPEIYLNAADVPNIPLFMPDYKGVIRYLRDGEVIDLGGRQIEVLFTPGHTPGSTSFIDKKAAYGFSADAFGSGNLLLDTNFSTLIATCERASDVMERYGLVFFYPGHYFGSNIETPQRIRDIITLSGDILSGKVTGGPNNRMARYDKIATAYGISINYGDFQMK